MEAFTFKIKEITPIGLQGDSQRPMHTNIVGQILGGSVAVDDLVSVPLKGGCTLTVVIKFLTAEYNSPDRFPQTISFDEYGKYTCMLSLRIPPDKAHLVDPDGVITKC